MRRPRARPSCWEMLFISGNVDSAIWQSPSPLNGKPRSSGRRTKSSATLLVPTVGGNHRSRASSTSVIVSIFDLPLDAFRPISRERISNSS